MADTEANVRLFSPEELATFVAMYRQSLGWSQETLAEISGLTARTIQRVEKGETSSTDTRRALARAFQIEDIDAFNKPHPFKSHEQIKKEAEEFQRKHMTLPVSVATDGKQLADLAENAQMRCFQQPDGVGPSIAELAANIFDSMSDYGEVSDCYSHTDKLKVHADFGEQIEQLRGLGYSICFALRRTSISGKDWVDRTPMAVGIAYAFVVKKGEEPKLVAVPKALQSGL